MQIPGRYGNVVVVQEEEGESRKRFCSGEARDKSTGHGKPVASTEKEGGYLHLPLHHDYRYSLDLPRLSHISLSSMLQAGG